VISILIFLTTAWTVWTLYVVLFGVVPLSPEVRTYFNSLTAVDYALCFGGATLSFIAAVALLMLRKTAAPLFVATLALTIVSLTWEVAVKGRTDAIDGAGLVVTTLLFGLEVWASLYAWHLAHRGVLR
jgi:hypothetical protein